MRHWILLRHGESQANADGRLAGQLDVPLTGRGREQAIEAGRALARWPLAQAWSSDLRRAEDTATLLLEEWARLRQETAPTLQRDPALRERSVGDWAEESRERLRADGRMPSLTSWSLAPPGGESQGQLAHRVIPAMAAIEAQFPGLDGAILVVTHGGVIRVIQGLLEGMDREAIGFFGIHNGDPIHLHLSVNRFSSLCRALLPETL